MNAWTGPGAGPEARPAVRKARRLSALVRAETLLLVRSRTPLADAAFLPVVLLLLFVVFGDAFGRESSGPDAATGLVVMLVVVAQLFVVYHHVTTVYVARREDRVLQRLLTGTVTRLEALLAPALPAAVVLVLLVVLGYGGVVLLIGPPGLVHPALVLWGVLGGAAMLTTFAAATAGLSRTAWSVQLTTLPVVVGVLPFAGLVPTSDGGVFAAAVRFTPLRPVTELLWLGLDGRSADGTTLAATETFGAAVLPTAVLVGWTVLGTLAARRWMHPEPRR